MTNEEVDKLLVPMTEEEIKLKLLRKAIEDFNYGEATEVLRSDYKHHPDSPFAVGDVVKLKETYFNNNPSFSNYIGKSFIVSSEAQEDEKVFEYSLSGFPFLVWNSDIELVERICTYCHTIATSSKNCSKCGAPRG